MIQRILLAGGDGRALRMEPLLRARGYQVSTLGLLPQDEKSARIAEADALLFPYPFSVQKGGVPTLTGLTPHPEDILDMAAKGALVVAGEGLHLYLTAARAAGKELRDARYARDEAFLQENADISAEAAVWEAMRATEETLLGLAVLVVGYGRFGRATAKRLHALGANVWVLARREEARRLARSEGMQTVRPEEFRWLAPKLKLALNTAPARMITPKDLEALDQDCRLMELASAPYGFDREAAKKLGLLCDTLPGLPGRYAPLSAAGALVRAVMRFFAEAEA